MLRVLETGSLWGGKARGLETLGKASKSPPWPIVTLGNDRHRARKGNFISRWQILRLRSTVQEYILDRELNLEENREK